MTRKKVKLVWIVNDSSRKASLKKRRLGLMKKVSELATLCGVDAFCIIYCPDEPQPLVWPSREVVEQLMMRYNNKPEIERTKKQTTQETYLRERIVKVQENTKKYKKKNRDLEMGFLMWQLHHGKGIKNFDFTELRGLSWLVDEKMKDIRRRIDYFQQVPPFVNPPPHGDVGGDGGDGGDGGGARVGDFSILGGGGLAGPGDFGGNDTIENPQTWEEWFLDMTDKNTALGSVATSSGMSNYFPATGGIGGDSFGGGLDMAPQMRNLGGINMSAPGFGLGQMPLTRGITNLMMPQYGNLAGTQSHNLMIPQHRNFPGNLSIGGGRYFGPGMIIGPTNTGGGFGVGNVGIDGGDGGVGGVGVEGAVLPPQQSGGSGGGSNINDVVGGGGGSNVIGGSDSGPQDAPFGGASDQHGMPFDAMKNWPHNFNP